MLVSQQVALSSTQNVLRYIVTRRRLQGVGANGHAHMLNRVNLYFAFVENFSLLLLTMVGSNEHFPLHEAGFFGTSAC